MSENEIASEENCRESRAATKKNKLNKKSFLIARAPLIDVSHLYEM